MQCLQRFRSTAQYLDLQPFATATADVKSSRAQARARVSPTQPCRTRRPCLPAVGVRNDMFHGLQPRAFPQRYEAIGEIDQTILDQAA
jgi:hypothetical protein